MLLILVHYSVVHCSERDMPTPTVTTVNIHEAKTHLSRLVDAAA